MLKLTLRFESNEAGELEEALKSLGCRVAVERIANQARV